MSKQVCNVVAEICNMPMERLPAWCVVESVADQRTQEDCSKQRKDSEGVGSITGRNGKESAGARNRREQSNKSDGTACRVTNCKKPKQLGDVARH